MRDLILRIITYFRSLRVPFVRNTEIDSLIRYYESLRADIATANSPDQSDTAHWRMSEFLRDHRETIRIYLEPYRDVPCPEARDHAKLWELAQTFEEETDGLD